LALGVPDEGYSRNVPCALNLIFTFINWTHWTQKKSRHMTLAIQILAWERSKNMAGLSEYCYLQLLYSSVKICCFQLFCSTVY